jgi:hypothetical protein
MYNKYESWMKNFWDWGDLPDLEEYGTILAMSMVITGSAKEWYNLNMRVRETECTLDMMSEEMFLDIFPDDYHDILRETFENVCQGDEPLKT